MKTKNLLFIIGLVAIIVIPWENSFGKKENFKSYPNKIEEVSLIKNKDSVSLKDSSIVSESSTLRSEVALISDCLKKQSIAKQTKSLISDLKLRLSIWDIIPNENDMLKDNEIL